MPLNNAGLRAEIIDSHVHFDDDRFDADRDRVYNDAYCAGVCTMVVPATTQQRWGKLQSIANHYPGVFPSYGLHPLYCNQHRLDHLVALEQMLSDAVAIGECGLDRQKNTQDLDQQRFFFEAQIDIAKRHRKPMIIHARNAVEETTLILKNAALDREAGNGVIHSFNGSIEQAHRMIDMNFTLSFGGAITRSNARRLHKLAGTLPLDSMMLETDAPDQTGAMHRGKRNEPQWITEVISAVATIRPESKSTITNTSNRNARRLFQLPESGLMTALTR